MEEKVDYGGGWVGGLWRKRWTMGKWLEGEKTISLYEVTFLPKAWAIFFFIIFFYMFSFKRLVYILDVYHIKLRCVPNKALTYSMEKMEGLPSAMR